MENRILDIRILYDVISNEGNCGVQHKLDMDIINHICLYGVNIMCSTNFKKSLDFIQHGNISVLEHSLSVAYMSLWLVKKLHLNVDKKSLVRGALLHDYFLYDWHTNNGHPLHGFTHPKTALDNANRDFHINKIESDIILKHMFPLNIKPPMYKESMIVCLADKISATIETILFRKSR
jgi:Predicted HD superfamily hydrolase